MEQTESIPGGRRKLWGSGRVFVEVPQESELTPIATLSGTPCIRIANDVKGGIVYVHLLQHGNFRLPKCRGKRVIATLDVWEDIKNSRHRIYLNLRNAGLWHPGKSYHPTHYGLISFDSENIPQSNLPGAIILPTPPPLEGAIVIVPISVGGKMVT